MKEFSKGVVKKSILFLFCESDILFEMEGYYFVDVNKQEKYVHQTERNGIPGLQI